MKQKKTEIESLKETETWDLVPTEKRQNIIPGRWMHKIKPESNGNIDNFKARYVAKGFNQIEGTEYSDILLQQANLKPLKLY